MSGSPSAAWRSGPIWGHGSYVAPDWTADWLHREAMFILDRWSGSSGGYAALPAERQAALQSRLQQLMRTNTYDAGSGTLTIDPVRAAAFDANAAHYSDVFTRGRDEYAIPPGALTDADNLRKLAAFFFWTSWAAVDQPSGRHHHLHEQLAARAAGRQPADRRRRSSGPASASSCCSPASARWPGTTRRFASTGCRPKRPPNDPLLASVATPSQRAVVKYFWVVSALILVQILLGVVAAHYGVEGNAFYGIPDRGVPAVLDRPHLARPARHLLDRHGLAGRRPLHRSGGQRRRAEVAAARRERPVRRAPARRRRLDGRRVAEREADARHGAAWFYLGHSGYEYIDLGRLWQIALLGRAVPLAGADGARHSAGASPAGRSASAAGLFLISSAAIAVFYMAALGYGRRTNLAIAEYWRWWVVHLWVEGFFEVFATVVIAFLFARLKLVAMRTAAQASVLSATIFLSGGIIGTLHHLYFTGTPTVVIALGSVFSALEVVPLLFVGFEAWENLRLSRSRPWVQQYRWPIYFFVSVAFWNLVGAGLFGFMINPPIALYYMQGLNTTPVHGHAALFGVYGMLGIGLMLFSLRALDPVPSGRMAWSGSGSGPSTSASSPW